jgi:hypothetical protein
MKWQSCFDDCPVVVDSKPTSFTFVVQIEGLPFVSCRTSKHSKEYMGITLIENSAFQTIRVSLPVTTTAEPP